MKITFLSENKTDQPPYLGEHGLSVLVETEATKILFDAGASDLMHQHAKEKKLDLGQVDLCVISHGHFDHTGGIPSFVNTNKKAPIVVHKEGFQEAYYMEKGVMEKEPCSILWTEEQRLQIEPRLYETEGPYFWTKDVWVSGTIPEQYGNESIEDFYIKEEDGSYRKDPMKHEQFLVVREKGELYLFFGCSHKGVFPALNYVKDQFPNEKIRLLVAGMHLYNGDCNMISRVIQRLLSYEIPEILPVHCTGIHGICQMKQELPNVVKIACVGDEFEY
jgi:7,8-dihydropterin-6-yl-methyl-4-(beta-D-ribofuranosyl)aminobenzene 5'-phosphate synthase